MNPRSDTFALDRSLHTTTDNAGRMIYHTVADNRYRRLVTTLYTHCPIPSRFAARQAAIYIKRQAGK